METLWKSEQMIAFITIITTAVTKLYLRDGFGFFAILVIHAKPKNVEGGEHRLTESEFSSYIYTQYA